MQLVNNITLFYEKSLIEGRLERGFEGMDVGRGLSIQLINVNVERGYIDFKRVA